MAQDHIESKNRYTILGVVGEGSNSEVFKALKSDVSGQINTIVALKVLKSPDLIEAWKREFESLRRVRSKYCVSVIGFEWAMDRPALCLEYVDGYSLTQICKRINLSNGEVLVLVHQIYYGLEDLWEGDLFHGDLSPGNVLVNSNGQVRLVDFGLGNWDGQNRQMTPRFAAPEAGQNPTGSKSGDLYSLGKVLEFLIESIEGETRPEILKLMGSLLERAPEKRKFLVKTNLEDPNSLSQKIKLEKQKEKGKEEVTQEYTIYSEAMPIRQPNKKYISKSANFKMATVILLFFSIVGSIGYLKLKKSQVVTSAHLSLRPKHWKQIWVNGNEKGYTPLELKNLPPGDYLIKWKSASENGERTLTLKAGQNRVLTESFFFQTKD